MPSKGLQSGKRYISSDSEDSIITETPKKSTIGAKRKPNNSDEEMVQKSDKYDNIRLSNGKINGISMDTTGISIGPALSPHVVLNRNDIETYSKRKSLGFNAPKATPIGERDERIERIKRQTERVDKQRRSVGGLAALAATPTATSTGVSMSGVQLRKHYQTCIEMSTTNKINAKNAFGLHLIDNMSELIREDTQNGCVNFKLAGSALDAGAKIYCHRVDSVHAEAQKVASSLVMALNNEKNSNNNGSNDMNADDNQMDDQNEELEDTEGQQKQKRKKTKRNVKTLAQNIESLNATKLETNLEIDPVFHHLSAAFDMGNVNSLLMANLKLNPSGLLLLDSNSSLNFDNYNVQRESTMQNVSQFYPLMNEIIKSSTKICPKLSNFEFLNRDEGINLIPREEDPSFTRRDSFTFDLNADVEDIEDLENEYMGGGDIFDNDVNDDDDCNEAAAEGTDETVKKSLIRAMNMQGVGDLVKMLSDKPNDYTYFNPKLLSTWAGPLHWKRMPFWNRNRTENQGTDGDKPRRQRKQFPEQHYKEEFDEEEADQMGGNDQKLKVATLQKWSTNNNELKLPQDHGFDPKMLAQSFIKPDATFQCAKSHEDVLDTTINSDNSFGAPPSPGTERYDYDDDDDIPTGGFTDPLDLAHSQPYSQLNTNTNMAFIGDNLVEQPYDLENILINFAKFAKKMDVKRLKKAMWDVIIPLSEPLSPTTPELTIPRKSPTNLNFTHLYKTLPQKITPIMTQNLSAPIAFVTLLHLCNEKNLKLIGTDDMSDFIIETE
ncbi:condensin complex subunit 2-like [Oppia nitens]|uniref:condensin complex subunit 2-like n=1 Tax=Oppia nitens TaxID=1686743 RepID=UPI0023DC0E17|nr:condensin complex subunit 2-like [Oppia nitens]